MCMSNKNYTFGFAYIYCFFAIALILRFPSHVEATSVEINLEQEFSDSFVLATKKIEIPDYPLAFNPSIVRWNDSILLSFRVIPNRKESYVSYIGLVWLNDDFTPQGNPHILQLRDESSIGPSRAEDARLIKVGDDLYIVYTDNPYPTLTRAGFRMYIGKLIWDGIEFSITDNECLSQFEGDDPDSREKNWVPFDYKGKLFLAYTLTPHKILQPIIGTGSCTTICTSLSSIQWKWGILRGGTCAQLEGDEYLSFFHSSIPMTSTLSPEKKIFHYFMGAYTFRKDPPFNITRISPKPIVGKNFYEGAVYKPYWKPVKVVFPCGFISDTDFIWIAYGRDDHEMWVTTLDKKALLESLMPLKEANAQVIFENIN